MGWNKWNSKMKVCDEGSIFLCFRHACQGLLKFLSRCDIKVYGRQKAKILNGKTIRRIFVTSAAGPVQSALPVPTLYLPPATSPTDTTTNRLDRITYYAYLIIDVVVWQKNI